jgi:hypothetical protein
MKNLLHSICVGLLFTHYGYSQIQTINELEGQINAPTIDYQQIRTNAELLFQNWHDAHPNDTGWAPFEKKYAR